MCGRRDSRDRYCSTRWRIGGTKMKRMAQSTHVARRLLVHRGLRRRRRAAGVSGQGQRQWAVLCGPEGDACLLDGDHPVAALPGVQDRGCPHDSGEDGGQGNRLRPGDAGGRRRRHQAQRVRRKALDQRQSADAERGLFQERGRRGPDRPREQREHLDDASTISAGARSSRWKTAGPGRNGWPSGTRRCPISSGP